MLIARMKELLKLCFVKSKALEIQRQIFKHPQHFDQSCYFDTFNALVTYFKHFDKDNLVLRVHAHEIIFMNEFSTP